MVTVSGKCRVFVVGKGPDLVLHLSGLIPIIFPTVLIWNLKKDTVKGITKHYRAVIGFQLMIFGIILGCLWVYWKVNIPTPLIGVLLANGLFSIANTIKVMNGDPFMKMPFSKNVDKNVKSK